MKKGFTLIELLVVIAILAVLSAGLFIVIDPLEKIAQANDAKAQNDIGQLATAAEAYATVHNGTYATAAELVSAGELKLVPSQANYTYTPIGSGIGFYVQLKSKRYASAYWTWCASTGKIGSVATAGNCP